jgi:transposase
VAAADRRLAHRQREQRPIEAVNSLIKRVKRAAFGITSFGNYRIRSLLYAGKPNWGLLATVTPR